MSLELLEQIFSRPDDDGARALYADWLLERGNPRGEFIALQLGRARNPRRENGLAKRHLAEWLGPLAPLLVKGSVQFERGFASGGRFQLRPRGEHLGAAIGHPLWSTFRSLTYAGDGVPALAAIVANPVMRSLRSIEGAPGALFVALANSSQPFAVEKMQCGRLWLATNLFAAERAFYEQLGWPVEQVIYGTGLAVSITREQRERAYADLAGLPALRELEIDFLDREELRSILRGAISRRSFALRIRNSNVLFLRVWLPELVAGAKPTLDLALVCAGWRMSVAPDSVELACERVYHKLDPAVVRGGLASFFEHADGVELPRLLLRAVTDGELTLLRQALPRTELVRVD